MAISKNARSTEGPTGTDVQLREGLIPVSMEKAKAISAIFEHFASNPQIVGFGIYEDEESGLTFIEVNSTNLDQAFVEYLDDSSRWWVEQPKSWHEIVHLALW